MQSKDGTTPSAAVLSRLGSGIPSDAVPQLVAPTVDLHEAWLASHEEWGPGEHEDGFGLGPDVDTTTPAGFAAWVHFLTEEDPGTLWWIVEGEDVVGGIALRAADDPSNDERGHIGYGIRPSCRGRGLATWALGEVLREAGRRGFERVLVVCDASNLASARVAEHHGGRLESAGDAPKRRYWIPVSV
jgi:predicted acetyltransferase